MAKKHDAHPKWSPEGLFDNGKRKMIVYVMEAVGIQSDKNLSFQCAALCALRAPFLSVFSFTTSLFLL